MKEFESDIFFSFNSQENLFDNNQRLCGKLYVSNSSGIKIKFINIVSTLEIFSALLNQNSKSFTVYGQTSDGKRFTASQCYSNNSNANFTQGSFSTQKGEILISTLFFGEWLNDIDNIQINKGRVRFSYLEHWLGNFEVNNNYFEEGKRNFSVDLEQFETNLNLEIDTNTTLRTSKSWQKNIELNKKLIFNVQQYLSYEFKNAIAFQDYNKLNFKLHNFFRTILPKKDIYIEEQYITVLENEVEIYSSNKHYSPEVNNVSWLDFLYLYNDETIQDILLNWFTLQSDYGRIFDLLTPILEEKPFIYLEHSFLNVIQWYEGFCRIKYPTSNEDKKVFESKIENIVSQVSDCEDKKLIKDITQFSYEFPLSKQLKKLFNDFGLKDILSINTKNLDSIIFYIVKNRNKLTHPTQANDLNYGQIVALKEILKYFTYIILVKTLKLEEDTHKVNNIKKNVEYYYAKFIERKT
ncbi:HEPN domain-containing protein [Aliarcobacter butzleri]